MTYFYFHTDRRTSLHAGQVINLTNERTAIGAYATDRAEFFATCFPAGVTEHGANYLLNTARAQPAQDTLGLLEVLAEWIRRASYPHLPSRLQSFFAWRSLADARQFAQRFALQAPAGSPISSTIWEVEAESAGFESDMNRLTLGECWLDALIFIDAYWRRSYTAAPNVEVLLQPPVRIIRRAT